MSKTLSKHQVEILLQVNVISCSFGGLCTLYPNRIERRNEIDYLLDNGIIEPDGKDSQGQVKYTTTKAGKALADRILNTPLPPPSYEELREALSGARIGIDSHEYPKLYASISSMVARASSHEDYNKPKEEL